MSPPHRKRGSKVFLFRSVTVQLSPLLSALISLALSPGASSSKWPFRPIHRSPLPTKAHSIDWSGRSRTRSPTPNFDSSTRNGLLLNPFLDAVSSHNFVKVSFSSLSESSSSATFALSKIGGSASTNPSWRANLRKRIYLPCAAFPSLRERSGLN